MERIEISSKNEIIGFDKVLSGLGSGEFDGSAALWKNKERENQFYFSDPYMENQLVLVWLKGEDIDVTSVKQLHSKKIGLIKGYIYDIDLIEETNVEFVYSTKDQDNLEKLLSEEIDYMLVDKLLMHYMLTYQLNDVNQYLSIGEKPFQTKGLHFALSKVTPNAEEIISKFNTEISAMMKDGSFNEIIGLSWIKMDVNHDGVSELVFSSDASAGSIPKNTYTLFSGDTESKGFYINNVYYKDWDSIPSQYKNTTSFPKTPQSKQEGLLRIDI